MKLYCGLLGELCIFQINAGLLQALCFLLWFNILMYVSFTTSFSRQHTFCVPAFWPITLLLFEEAYSHSIRTAVLSSGDICLTVWDQYTVLFVVCYTSFFTQISFKIYHIYPNMRQRPLKILHFQGKDTLLSVNPLASFST